MPAAFRHIADAVHRCEPGERLLLGVLRPWRNGFGRRAWAVMRAALRQRGARNGTLRWVRLASGPFLRVPVADMLGCLYFEQEAYEPRTTAFLLRELRPGDVFLDIGANYGYFTLLAAGLVGEAGSVYACEAMPAIRQTLMESVAHNGMEDRITVCDRAVLDRDGGSAVLYVSKDPAGAGIGSMFPWEGHLKSGGLDSGHRIDVATTRVDSWLAQCGVQRVDVVKIDVEGAELPVLNGMCETLTRCRPRSLIVETGLTGAVADRLNEYGYRGEPLELHDQSAKWGNILFRRLDAGTKVMGDG